MSCRREASKPKNEELNLLGPGSRFFQHLGGKGGSRTPSSPAAICLLLGSRTSMKVRITRTEATASFASETIDQRKCRYAHETMDRQQQTLFKQYTKETCLYECALKVIPEKNVL